MIDAQRMVLLIQHQCVFSYLVVGNVPSQFVGIVSMVPCDVSGLTIIMPAVLRS